MNKIHLFLEDNQQIWFTSDLHYMHKNIIKFCKRPFTDDKEMNKALLSNWNNTVCKNDIIFMLGDYCWTDSSTVTNKFLNMSNGIIYFLPGNHDSEKQLRNLPSHVVRIDAITEVFIYTFDKKLIARFMLSHLPLLTWPNKNTVMNLHGHVHTLRDPNLNVGFDKDLNYHPLQYDVGVDYNYYHPVNLSSILFLFNEKKAQLL